MRQFTRHFKRILVGVAGGIIVCIGLVMIPYPGPGWLVVFAGLALLATEFEFARRWLTCGRHKLALWKDWLRHQHWTISILVLLAVGVVTLTTIWLMNGFGIADNLFGMKFEWAHSPFVQ